MLQSSENITFGYSSNQHTKPYKVTIVKACAII